MLRLRAKGTLRSERVKLTFKLLRQKIYMALAPPSGHGLDWVALEQIVLGIVTSRPDEIACDECYGRLDRFAEVVMADLDAAGAMPLIQDHLNRCPDCREEFVVLLTAVRAVA
jgi:hypothetical protein